MPKIGSIHYKYLKEFFVLGDKTSDGMINMQGFDWSRELLHPKYLGDRFSKIDLSNSRSEKGFLIRDAVFDECCFDKSIWWLAEMYGCIFHRCSFNDCRLYTSSLRGKFYDCSFRNISARGENFSFGRGSVYKGCVFESVDIRNIIDVVGVKFEDCTISGTFTNGIFRGRRYALQQRFRSVTDIFSKVYWPVKFIRCDLSHLRTKDVIFERDVIFKDCQMGDQSFLKKNQ